MPRVSVIMPTRDRARLIGRAIRSLGRQTYRDFELVVGDDGCTDDTLAVVEREATRAGVPFRIVNGGGAPAGQTPMRNMLVDASDSEFVACLDDDDEAFPDRLASGVRMMDADPGLAVAGGAAFFRVRETGACYVRRTPATDLGVRRQLLRGAGFFHVTVTMRRAHLPDRKPYDETMDRSQDSLLWAQMAGRHDIRFANTATVTVTRHVSAGEAAEAARERGFRALEERLTELNVEFLDRHGAPGDAAVARWLALPQAETWNPGPESLPDREAVRRTFRALDRRGRRIAGPRLALAVERRTRWHVLPHLPRPAGLAARIAALRGARILAAVRRRIVSLHGLRGAPS